MSKYHRTNTVETDPFSIHSNPLSETRENSKTLIQAVSHQSSNIFQPFSQLQPTSQTAHSIRKQPLRGGGFFHGGGPKLDV